MKIKRHFFMKQLKITMYRKKHCITGKNVIGDLKENLRRLKEKEGNQKAKKGGWKAGHTTKEETKKAIFFRDFRLKNSLFQRRIIRWMLQRGASTSKNQNWSTVENGQWICYIRISNYCLSSKNPWFVRSKRRNFVNAVVWSSLDILCAIPLKRASEDEQKLRRLQCSRIKFFVWLIVICMLQNIKLYLLFTSMAQQLN